MDAPDAQARRAESLKIDVASPLGLLPTSFGIRKPSEMSVSADAFSRDNHLVLGA